MIERDGWRIKKNHFPTWARLQIAVGRIDVNLINRFIQMWSAQTRNRISKHSSRMSGRRWATKIPAKEAPPPPKKVNAEKYACGGMRKIVTKFKWLATEQWQSKESWKKKRSNCNGNGERHRIEIYICSMCFVANPCAYFTDKTNFWRTIARHRKIWVIESRYSIYWLNQCGSCLLWTMCVAWRMQLMCTIPKWHGVLNVATNGFPRQMPIPKGIRCTFISIFVALIEV